MAIHEIADDKCPLCKAPWKDWPPKRMEVNQRLMIHQGEIGTATVWQLMCMNGGHVVEWVYSFDPA